MSLFVQSRKLLDLIVEEIGDAPERRYVSDGQPVIDCEQLTVHPQLMTRGTTRQQRPLSQAGPTTITLVVTRSWPTQVAQRSGLPSLQQMEDSGRKLTDGGEQLWLATSKAVNRMDCNGSVDQAQSLGAVGGFAGWQITVRMTMLPKDARL